MLTADELLAGGELTFEVEVPQTILRPSHDPSISNRDNNTDKDFLQKSNKVKLRPLTVKDLQRIERAAKDSDNLTAVLMVQCSLVEPALSVQQVGSFHVGLVEYLLMQVNRISGISTSLEEVDQAAEDPLAKASFILAKEFGWTPHDINNLTLGQVVLHLQMLKNRRVSAV